MKTIRDAVLCYVSGNFAYFTTQDLDKQWGDDWDDAPYEHNAGSPYTPRVYHYSDERGSVKDPSQWNEDGTPKWDVFKIAIDGDFDTPSSRYGNSPCSVDEINKGAAPWITFTNWSSKGERTYVPAGTTLKDFIEIAAKSGSEVLMTRSQWEQINR